MRLGLRYTALSDVGRVRKDNQDSGYAGPHLLAVADGVGGSARGDLASSTAVAALRRLDERAPGDVLEAVAGALHRAHDKIAELVEQDRSVEGTSTTATLALFDGARIGVGHVGDSRAYLLRGGELTQLTKDHTFVQGLVDEGRITDAEARTHPHRNLILKAIDAVHEVDPDLFTVDLAVGDRLLLCSDGCCGVLADADLADILGSGSLDFVAVELVREALEAGSSDNVTVVVADVVDEDARPLDDDATYAAASTGPMIVGAAADQPRLKGARGFRAHRSGDTGELEAIRDDTPDPSGGGMAATAPRAAEPVDPEELRYAPRPRPRLWRLRSAVVLLVALVLLAVCGYAAWTWSQSQFYVAADDDEVAIFRGIDATVPGLDLSSVEERSGLQLDTLPGYSSAEVRDGIEAGSLGDARALVSRLSDLVSCPELIPGVSLSPAPQPTVGAAASPTPTPSVPEVPSPLAPDCEQG